MSKRVCPFCLIDHSGFSNKSFGSHKRHCQHKTNSSVLSTTRDVLAAVPKETDVPLSACEHVVDANADMPSDTLLVILMKVLTVLSWILTAWCKLTFHLMFVPCQLAHPMTQLTHTQLTLALILLSTSYSMIPVTYFHHFQHLPTAMR